jgi:ribosomal protein L11 methyltransferase
LPRRWFEIALTVPSSLVDEAAALLDFAGFGGIEVRERGDEADVVVVVEVDTEGGEREQAATAHDAIAILGAGEPRVTELDPKIWTENWKSHFARRTFAGRIEVRPPWEETPTEGLISLVINPGMAFGTGLHETTAGCLELLVDEVRPGMCVADVGCGSGILAIAAARLGAIDVLATDVDPLAVEATRENIEANAVGAAVKVELEPGEVGVPEWENDARPGLSGARRADAEEKAAEAGAEPGAASEGPRLVPDTAGPTPNNATSGGFAARGPGAFDLLVANILAETLVELRPALAAAVRPGGTLVLSGIESRRLKMVEEAFIGRGWRLARTVPKGDWVSLSLHHDASAPAAASSRVPEED